MPAARSSQRNKKTSEENEAKTNKKRKGTMQIKENRNTTYKQRKQE